MSRLVAQPTTQVEINPAAQDNAVVEVVESDIEQHDIDADGDVITAGRDVDVVKGDYVQIQELHNHYYVLNDPELAATVEHLKVGDRDAEVWVIWRGASWHNNQYTFDERKLDQFFRSSMYQRSLRESDAIACVGLASSWMKESLRLAPDRDERMQQMSDRRARILCGRVSSEMRDLGIQPTLVGVGIGFNEIKADDLPTDQKQRALVLIHVKTQNGGRPATKNETENVVRAVLQKRDLSDFAPESYSEVSNDRPICWFTSEEGVLHLEGSNC